jgi:16S rRNA (uracil1498-N3)-methyltransferase
MVEPLFHSDNLSAEVGSTIELAGAEGKHAVLVRRMRVGEAIQLSDGKGIRVRGVVSEITGSTLLLQVAEKVLEEKPLRQITLIQALAKGDRDELAIQAATELGVMTVIPWQASRSISIWEGNKKAKGQARWQQIVGEASKQSLRSFAPEVKEVATTKEIAALIQNFDLVLVLEVSAQFQLSELNVPKKCSIALVVGPEGGIDKSELGLLEKAGAKSVNLGPNILRTSTAGPAMVAFLMLGNV